MSIQKLRIATRKSPLALWQTQHVSEILSRWHPALVIELVEMTTQGDKILDAPLANLGGKGLFVKELEQGLLEGRAEIAVHSMKDVPIELPAGLMLAVMMTREEPYDALVSNHYPSLSALPSGALVGTSSLRRQCQLLALRPDLRIRTLRGNVGTRLSKLDQGEFAAILLAAAGLKRLGLAPRIREYLPPEVMLPAIGQGAIGIECRQQDEATRRLIAPLNDPATYTRVQAERAINNKLGGSCQVPIAGFAEIDQENQLWLRGLVGDITGQRLLRATRRGSLVQAESLGTELAEELLAQGAAQLLNECTS